MTDRTLPKITPATGEALKLIAPFIIDALVEGYSEPELAALIQEKARELPRDLLERLTDEQLGRGALARLIAMFTGNEEEADG